MSNQKSAHAPSRVVIENVRPAVDDGRFPAKRIIGDPCEVTADIFCDGHDLISALVLYRPDGDPIWREISMLPLGNDLWSASFTPDHLGEYHFTVTAWVDEFKSWRRDFRKKLDAGLDVAVDLLSGTALIERAASRAQLKTEDAEILRKWAAELRSQKPLAQRAARSLDETLAAIADRHPDRSRAATYDRELRLWIDRERARFSSWYEMFPRSCTSDPATHGTFRACEKQLEYVAEMGFDILYLPPIHPIGERNRKGRNNSTTAKPGDPGSPWAIGAQEGGHTAIHRDLGTLEDFHSLKKSAESRGIELAIDVAFQSTPDHPYVREHPDWFKHRADGSIQYAENPPKKYEDIYPFDFESQDRQALWNELKSVVFFWLKHGVRVFRVDNPHTKPFAFWQWLIEDVRRQYPETIFLSEAFTRPKVMYRLAKLGFTQSYTYFTWRNTKQELQKYLTDLTQTEVRDFFRPNFWPNTPDILPEFLQFSGRPGFAARLVLAATLSSSYGIYGPAYELLEHEPVAPGKEEYLNSEKYEIKQWDLQRPDSLKGLIERVNQIRRDNRALQSNDRLQFHDIDNERLIAYSKSSTDGANAIVVVVNLDPYHKHSGWLTLPLDQLQIDAKRSYQVHDLLSNARFLWQGPRNYVELNPETIPAHIFAIRRHVRTERDFDYYM